MNYKCGRRHAYILLSGKCLGRANLFKVNCDPYEGPPFKFGSSIFADTTRGEKFLTTKVSDLWYDTAVFGTYPFYRWSLL